VPVGDAAALALAMEDIWNGNEEQQRRSAYQVYAESGGWEHTANIVHHTVTAILAS
jgi:hypothetical protein